MPMMQLWATGNNAWGQLDFDSGDGDGDGGAAEPQDFWTFRKVFEAPDIRDVVAGEFGTLGEWS